MAVSAANRLRYRAILIARAAKDVFFAAASHVAAGFARRFLVGWLLRQLFLGPDGKPHRAGEIVLAELRDHARAQLGMTAFDPDPLVMARRVGRREQFDRLMYFLHLDESEVQALMQVDDGLGGDGYE